MIYLQVESWFSKVDQRFFQNCIQTNIFPNSFFFTSLPSLIILASFYFIAACHNFCIYYCESIQIFLHKKCNCAQSSFVVTIANRPNRTRDSTIFSDYAIYSISELFEISSFPVSFTNLVLQILIVLTIQQYCVIQFNIVFHTRVKKLKMYARY